MTLNTNVKSTVTRLEASSLTEDDKLQSLIASFENPKAPIIAKNLPATVTPITEAALGQMADLPVSAAAASIRTLMEMLEYCRPARSKSERKFISRFITPLGVDFDGFGNAIKRIGTAPIMWSCHTDTVHHKGGKQTVISSKGEIKLSSRSQSNCLGADDTAGVWLMREMILANVPGLYIFHREEECGGNGSSYIARKTPELLKGIDFAIALDRKGISDVITHQMCGRCCSDEFASSLIKELGIMGLKPCSGGTFTDTANYIGLVGECTNLCVGYYDQHSKRETLDWDFLLQMRAALIGVNANNLTVKRKPGEVDEDDFYGYGGGVYGGAYGGSSYRGYGSSITSRGTNRRQGGWSSMFDDADQAPRYVTMLRLVENHPDVIADILEEEMGVNADEIYTAIMDRVGFVRT